MEVPIKTSDTETISASILLLRAGGHVADAKRRIEWGGFRRWDGSGHLKRSSRQRDNVVRGYRMDNG